MCLSALTRFGVTQTLAQSFLSSQGLCKIGSHWTSPIIEGCGFFSFSSGFTVFLLSRPCIFRGGKVGLGKLPRARRRKANIAQQHRGIMSHCESWVRTLSMEVVHLEWLELGQGTTHCRILDSSLVPSLLFLPSCSFLVSCVSAPGGWAGAEPPLGVCSVHAPRQCHPGLVTADPGL